MINRMKEKMLSLSQDKCRGECKFLDIIGYKTRGLSIEW
jgi:hypothetical protein